MKKLSLWNSTIDVHFDRRNLMAFDMDDTLTHNGSLPAEVLAKLEELQARGFYSVMVTGRPAGWADAIIKLLPFDAVIAENGAVLYWWPKKKSQRQSGEEPKRLFWSEQGYSPIPPDDLQERLDPISIKVLTEFSKARIASDQPYRIYDLAIDFAEEVKPPLSLDDARRIQAIFEEHGAVAKISSIHVNGWFGNFSKVDGLKRILKEYNLSLEENVVYMGDSPNDGPLFETAGMSIGVANIKNFVGKVDFHHPILVTEGESAQGALGAIGFFLDTRKV